MPLIQPGAMIRNANEPDFGGTFGCVVVARDDPRRRYLLTAAHVIGIGGYARNGDAIEARIDGEDRWVKIAEFETAVKLRDAPGVLQECDAAIARITDDGLVGDEIAGLGVPLGTAPQLFEEMRLQFRGARSGLVTTAQVQSTGNVVPITYDDIASGGSYTLRFRRQIFYGIRSGAVWRTAAAGQDSGALVLDADGLAVGLHIGRTPFDSKTVASVCTPIDTVLEALGMRLPQSVASAPGQPAAQSAADGSGAFTAADRIGVVGFNTIDVSLRSLLEPHNAFGGCQWQLSPSGLIVAGRLDRSPGALVTVPRVWTNFGTKIAAAALKYRVPVELIVATICAESSGNPDAIRREPGFIDEATTPSRPPSGHHLYLHCDLLGEHRRLRKDRHRLPGGPLLLRRQQLPARTLSFLEGLAVNVRLCGSFTGPPLPLRGAMIEGTSNEFPTCQLPRTPLPSSLTPRRR